MSVGRKDKPIFAGIIWNSDPIQVNRFFDSHCHLQISESPKDSLLSGYPDFNPRLQHGAFRLGFAGAFTAITRVQIPSGTPIKNQRDRQGFALHSWVQKGHDSVSLCTHKSVALKCLLDRLMAESVRTPRIEPYPAVRQKKPGTTQQPAQRA